MAHEDQQLKVAVVGYGMAGRLIHTPLVLAAGLRVSDIVTSDPARAAAARREVPGVRVHTGLAALLTASTSPDARPDLVVLGTPTGQHVEHALAVVAGGIPVVVDKPLALDESGARRVVVAAEAAGVPLTVFHNHRWDDEQRTLAGLLRAGTLGTVHRFERRWERWRPASPARWRETAVGDDGGLLLDLGVHLVDSAIALFGPVTSVYAEIRALMTATDDDVFLALTHASGTLSHLSAGSVVGAPGPRTRVLGSSGAFLVTRFEGTVGPFDAMDPGPGMAGWHVHGDQRSAVRCAPGGHVDFYRGVGRWLTEGGPAPVDPWDAVRNAAVLDAARRSAASGSTVALGG